MEQMRFGRCLKKIFLRTTKGLSIVSPESETYVIILFCYNRRKKMVKSNTVFYRFLELSIVSPELKIWKRESRLNSRDYWA